MLISLQLLLIVIVWSSALYWMASPRQATVRQLIIALTSAIVVFIYSPLALLLVLIVTLMGLSIFHLCRESNGLKLLPWAIFVPAFLFSFDDLRTPPEWLIGSPRSPTSVHLMTLGLSYYSIKTFGSIKMGLKAGRLSFVELVTANLFFPAFTSGPIDYAEKFSRLAFTQSFDGRTYFLGLMRIGIGIAKVSVFSPFVTGAVATFVLGNDLSKVASGDWRQQTAGIVFGYAFISFANLLLNFSGFTDIAVGAGKLYNLKISENFRNPLLAHSIQNFWQRWHLSLSGFITKYLFKPMMRATGRPFLSIVVSFFLIGMWHQISFGYLIWGIGHGTMLGIYSRYFRAYGAAKTPNYLSVRTLLGIAATILYVSFLSAVANLEHYETIGAFLGAAVRIGL